MGMASTYTLSCEAKRLMSPSETSVSRQATTMGPESRSIMSRSQLTRPAKNNGRLMSLNTLSGMSCVTGQIS